MTDQEFCDKMYAWLRSSSLLTPKSGKHVDLSPRAKLLDEQLEMKYPLTARSIYDYQLNQAERSDFDAYTK